MQNKHRKYVRRSIRILFIFIAILNIVAVLHAYKFTHFDAEEKERARDIKNLGLSEKISMLFLGVDLPRPTNKTLPQLPYKSVRINDAKNTDCWFIPANQAIGTVILYHGYGGEKSAMLDKAYHFHSIGYNVLLVDFMGAGGSGGNQTTIGYFEADQVASTVTYVAGTGERNIILFGSSMGAVAILRAVKETPLPVQKLILEYPFGTMIQTVKNRFSAMGLPAFPMAHLLTFWGGVINGFNAFEHNPEDYALRVKIPTLVLYGKKDERVTREEIEGIYDNLGGEKKLVTFPDAGHQNLLLSFPDIWTRSVNQFLQEN